MTGPEQKRQYGYAYMNEISRKGKFKDEQRRTDKSRIRRLETEFEIKNSVDSEEEI